MTKAEEIKKRAAHSADEIVKICETLPARVQRITDQPLGSGPGIASNYVSACRAKSHDDYVSKIATAAEKRKKPSSGWMCWWAAGLCREKNSTGIAPKRANCSP